MPLRDNFVTVICNQQQAICLQIQRHRIAYFSDRSVDISLGVDLVWRLFQAQGLDQHIAELGIFKGDRRREIFGFSGRDLNALAGRAGKYILIVNDECIAELIKRRVDVVRICWFDIKIQF